MQVLHRKERILCFATFPWLATLPWLATFPWLATLPSLATLPWLASLPWLAPWLLPLVPAIARTNDTTIITHTNDTTIIPAHTPRSETIG